MNGEGSDRDLEVVLSEEDRTRAIRLHEEIAGRLEELALIVGRNLGHSGRTPVGICFGSQIERLAEVLKQQPRAPVEEQRVLYHFDCFVFDDGSCGCYDNVRGLCLPC